MQDDLSSIEDAILKAAINPAAWSSVMAAFVRSFPGCRASLLGHDMQMAQGLPAAQAGYDVACVQSYYRHFHTINPFAPAWAGLPVGRVVDSREVVPEADLLRTEFYQDWLRPQQDLRSTVGAVVARDSGRLFLFSLHIEHRVAEVMAAQVLTAAVRLQGLMRHALEVNRMTLGLRLDAEALRHGIEPSDAAVLLLGADGVILHGNRRAETMLEEGDVLRRDPAGRLRMMREVERMRMEAALRLRPGGPLSFPVGGAGHEMRVVPLRPGSLGDLRMPLLLDRSPAALVVMRPSRRDRDGTMQVMQALGLTRAEAEVALALAEGATVAEVAETRRVSVQTVRNQVKSALGKTGSRRQADLVREVITLHRL
ncbi:helix-turn-helix transcriptional regulator [Rubellimicrobium roseum]|uniref:HTH luxR-type domain-containing protein n=1 Tax=Rubellimicrobium roseum TaxID=687525 RepID=A0A5C4N752_9RHOB|nr:LuxR C-terminal-related transcriptional regulator [Rubellimicrobium roseum]TNC67556.1 hypothetical protein FHG71_15260 [Rubellimicrobium roseum]